MTTPQKGYSVFDAKQYYHIFKTALSYYHYYYHDFPAIIEGFVRFDLLV